MRWVMSVGCGIMAAGLLLGAASKAGPPMSEQHAMYRSENAELPVRFDYPADWEVEESSGHSEVYTQVQLYAPASLESRMRSYVVVRAMPPKARGGRHASVAELATAYRNVLQLGWQTGPEHSRVVGGIGATQLDVTGTLRLPWHSLQRQDIAVTGQRVFFEKGGRLYELGWLTTPEAAPRVSDAFQHVLETLSIE